MKATYTRRQFLKRTGSAGLSVTALNVLTRTATAQTGKPPNILFFFPDQHRPDWTSINAGIGVRTPNMERLARNGVRFTQAVCPSPLCAPSRACLALGREYDRTGVPSNKHDLPDEAVTFYKLLRDAGYRVGGVGKFDLRKAASDWGIDGRHRVNGRVYFDEWGFTDGIDSEGKGGSLIRIVNRDKPEQARGESPYSKFLTDRNDGTLQRYLAWIGELRKAEHNYAFTKPMDIADDAYNDNWVGQNGLNLVESFPTDQPWFLQVNFPGPHPPMDITPGMAEWYRDAAFPGPHKNDELAPEAHTAIRRNYSAMVENIDRWLGRYFEAIEQRGELDNTIVVWSSDHGEMLGDHNLWGKQYPLQPSAGVPLLVSGPGVQKGHVHGGPATILDLTATFLDYAGVTRPDDMDSITMRPLLEGQTSVGRTHVLSGLNTWRLAFDGRFKLIRGYDPKSPKNQAYDNAGDSADVEILLFDLKSDPLEDTNIAAANPDIVKRLSAFLKPV
ncbi:MAG: sulfatase-like hydrolase/transferase [Candidatus Hydrogenedentes bacterium]|nr:sulfatase-like hydrolase/transferase [Candidatus Hydrogenedentota bacterium]